MQQEPSDGVTTTSEEMEDIRDDEPASTAADLPADTSHGAGSTTGTPQQVRRFDWPAVGMVVILGAIFAALAHVSAQPYTSLVPAAVLSATGCGLLITGARKLHTFKGAGIREAALGGLLLAILQFVSALSFPGVTRGLSTDPTSQPGFFTTWALVAVFAVLFSVIGAALGHMIFAPPRPLPPGARSRGRSTSRVKRAGEEAEENVSEEVEMEDLPEDSPGAEEQDESAESEPREAVETGVKEAHPAPSRMSNAIAILLLGLAPFLAGYVFAAAFDVALNVNRYGAGPFPTLRLLSALLPWQVPLPINLQLFNLTLTWRIPLLPGNPGTFDFQALEPLVLNAAGVACALLAAFRLEQSRGQAMLKAARRNALLMEALLGLILVLPANLWIAFGLHGLLQLSSIAVPLRTIQLLNPLTFTLNLITAPLACIIAGLAIFGMRGHSTNSHR